MREASPGWNETWMSVARTIARRSYSRSLKVGAVIVSSDNTRVLSLGYNGNYTGGPNEQDSDVPGESGLIHAEVNCLVKCDYSFHKGKVMYVTHSPCVPCSKLIINAGVTKVVYGEPYRDQRGLDILRNVGILVEAYDDVILRD